MHEGRDVVALGSNGPVAPVPREAARVRRPCYAYLLDADDDLADELDMRTASPRVSMLTARVLEAEPGDCDLAPWFAGRRRRVPGCWCSTA